MTQPRGEPISNADLHDYVDGRLEPVRSVSVALHLVESPSDAARVDAYRAQSDGLHALFDPVLDEPVPARLRDVIAQARNAVS